MNYYEHHIGDYAQATMHLTFVEDAAYSRLLRKYYAEETPIPADLKAAQRLVAARTREERDAVETVLNEFFELQDDGWHNKRADAEIERYSAKRAKAKRSAEARWSAERSDSEGNANASSVAMRTHSEGNALQSPDSIHQQDQDLLSSATPKTPPADLAKHKAERLAQVTDDAIAAFNASPLVKRNGGNLAAVSATVGREKRQGQIRRCLRTVRAICQENYGSPIITAEFWPDYWAEVATDDFHAGRQPGGRGHENWKPDFEFLTREDVMLKVYDRAAAEDAA